MKIGKCFSYIVILFLVFAVIETNAQQSEVASGLNTCLAQINYELAKDRSATGAWWYGWLATYSVATVGQGAIGMATENKSLRQDMVLGAATTLLGAAGQFIAPIKPDKNYKAFAKLPQFSADEKAAKLLMAETLLKQYASYEKEARMWQTHAMSGAVNLASGLITWIGFKRSVWDGVVNFALNTAITEAQIWTQPTRAMRYYKKYTHEYNDAFTNVESRASWTLAASPAGLALRIEF